MKRHISIFALLLCVFAAVGQGAGYYYVAANVPCTLTQSGKVGEMPFDSRNSTSGGYYDSANAENSFTKITYGIGLTLTAGNKEGYRFNGWYSHEKGWTEISKVTVESAGESVSKEKELTDGAVASAGRWTPGAGWDIPVVFAKYVKVWTVTTDVNPAGADAGTVTGGGTVDNGGSVTLTATANKGYEFSKWSDGNTENPRTIGNITGSVTYTAVFTKKVNAITSGPTIDNWTYGDTPKAPSASAQYTGSTGMTYTYYNSSKASLGSSPPTNAGTYYIRANSPSSDEYVSATSDYVQFSISRKTINTDNVSFSNKSTVYTGGAQTVTASSVPAGVTVTYSGNSRTVVGEQTATANFAATDATNCQVTTASMTAKLTITAATITGVTLKSTSITYDGQPHQPQVESVTANGKTFSTSSTGWTVTCFRNSVETENFTNAGTITVKVTGTGNLTGSSSADFTIGKKEISLDEVVFDDLTVTYDGTEKVITAANVPSGVTANYSSNKRTTVGEQQARVTFEPNDKNHTVSLTQKLATLKIEQATITAVTLNGTSATYDGDSHKPTVGWVTANNKTFLNSSVGWDVTYLRDGVATGDFTSPGTITVKATGTSNLKGSASATFTINKAEIESVALATVSATYDGKAHQPVVNSVTANSKGFSSASAGWTVAYTRGGAVTTDFTSAGTITVTVTGKNGLSGTASTTFTIAKKTINTTGVGFSNKSVTYDGTPKSITASNVPEGVEVTYSNNSLTDAGSQTATANFKPTDAENCTVSPTSKTATLTVTPASITAIALSATSATYDGQPHQPTVVSVTANGKTFTDAAIGWDVAYDKTDFTSVGTIKVTASGKKNLAGSANETFEIKSKSITITFDPNGGNAPLQTSKTVQCPGTYGTLPTPTRKGYDFTGWWTAKEGGTQITETTTVELTAAQTLYAQWEAKKYNLTIDPKGGLFNRSTKPTTFEGALTFDATNMNVIAVSVKEDGTPFLGYYTSSGVKVYNDAGKCVRGETYWDGDWPDGKYVNDGNLTVEARWSEAPRYDIVVEADPAKGTATGGGTFEAGTSVTLTATPSNGYAFAYWQREVSSIVSTDNPYEFTASSAAAGTYTAVFTGKVCQVTFMGVEATTPSFANVAVQVGKKWKDFFPEMTYPGHVLVGWYSQFVPFNDAYKIDGEANVPATPPPMLFAKWDEIPPVVIYADPSYKNTWITNSVDKKGDEITDVKARTVTSAWPANRDNKYWIKGWKPTLIPPLKVEKDETILAIWESYADVLDCPDLAEPGFRVDGNWKVYTEDHYPDVGESCLRLESATGNDVVSITLTGPGALTFHWRAQAGARLRVKRDGKEEGGVFTATDGEWAEEHIDIPAGETKVEFTCNQQEFDNKPQELDFIVWTQTVPVETYNVTYKKGTCDGVSGDGRTDEKTNGMDLVLADRLFTRDNYTQEGWSKNADGTTKDYALKGSYTEDAAITLYPYWLVKGKYTVSYSAGTGATGSAEAQTAHEGETVVLHGNGHFSRTGYSQDGWATSDLGEKAFDFDDPYDKNVSTNLYPCWTNNRYTVTFNPNGGSVTPAPKAVTFDEAYGDLPSPGEREGYKFDGWALASGSAVTAETIVKTAADHKLIAKWENDVGELSRILDCDNLKFIPGSVDGWTKCTDFWHKGDSCLRSTTANAEVKATITEPGTLTFWWRGAVDGNAVQLQVLKNGQDPENCIIKTSEWEEKNDKWFEGTAISVTIDAVPVVLTFKSTKVGKYVAIDNVTWTPDRKEPEYADTDTPVTGFSMADGKLGFSFIGDGSTYHLLGTNDLVAPMPWPMVFETNKASGTILFDIPVKTDEPKMFYRIRALIP